MKFDMCNDFHTLRGIEVDEFKKKAPHRDASIN